MTGFDQYDGASLAFSIRDLKISGAEYVSFAAAGDIQGFVNKVFAGNDVIIGSRFDDILNGYGGSNTLSGGFGDDALAANIQDNTVDVLTGGRGADSFLVSLASTAVSFEEVGITLTGKGKSQINDFNPGQGDKLEIAFIDQNFDFLPITFDQAFSGNAGSMIFTPGKRDGLFSIDTDGDARADVLVTLKGFKGRLDPAAPPDWLTLISESDLFG